MLHIHIQFFWKRHKIILDKLNTAICVIYNHSRNNLNIGIGKRWKNPSVRNFNIDVYNVILRKYLRGYYYDKNFCKIVGFK